MSKKVAMIPVRLGSKRIKKKNLRLINGKPLVSYVIESAINSGVFDEIYINSEADIFKEIAKMHGIKFYKRPIELSTDSATNDDFALDFMNNIECDIVIQLLATSPFITPKEIINFIDFMDKEKCDTLISVYNNQIECVYNGNAINFDNKKQSLPSQQLKPIKAFACGLMGWNVDVYKENMKKYGFGYSGGDGKVDYFTISGFSTIDVDNEEDFVLAETVAKVLSENIKIRPKYFRETEHIENEVPNILEKDGVKDNDLFDCNKSVINIDDVIKNKKNNSWSKRVINTKNNSATLISQNPGEGNRRHYHDSWNEWWYIVDGNWKWEIEGETTIVQKGDVVFIEKNKWHQITAIGNKPAIRLAVSREDVDHIYE